MKQGGNFFTYFIISFTFFLLGIFFSQSVAQNDIFSLGKTQKATVKSESENDFESKNVEKELNLSKFWKVYTIMKQGYYDADDISDQKLVDATIAGLVKGLGDKHSEYMTKQEAESFEELLAGDFEGIGAIVEKVEYGVLLDRIFEGSGAEIAGLRKGDVIVKVGGKETVDMDLHDAIKLIKGPAETTVDLEVYREGKQTTFPVTVMRKKVDIPSVEFESFEGNIGYIQINSFGEKTSDSVLAALLELKDTNGLIIDLRNNGGGYLESAGEILSNFIEKGNVLVTTKVKGDTIEQVVKSRNTGNIYKGKIVVLINENSASASEITAGALEEYDKAILVGKKSYGKGSVQVPYDLGDGSSLKLTIAKWFTPKDKNIDHEGIEPDIEVDFSEEDFEKKYDRQLEVAKKVIDIFIQKDARQLSIDDYTEKFPENNITK